MEANEEKVQVEDILLKISKGYSFPIIKCNDFGHKNSNAVMPIGIKVKIDITDWGIVFLNIVNSYNLKYNEYVKILFEN